MSYTRAIAEQIETLVEDDESYLHAAAAQVEADGGALFQRSLSQRQSSVSANTEIKPICQLSPQLSPAAALIPLSSVSPLGGNPLSNVILYIHTLIETSAADHAGLQVRDFILDIAGFNENNWEVNMIADVAQTIREWPEKHPNERMRIEVLRKIKPEQVQQQQQQGQPMKIVWAKVKHNGHQQQAYHANGTTVASDYQVIPLQWLELWSNIPTWSHHTDRAAGTGELQQQQSGGGVLVR